MDRQQWEQIEKLFDRAVDQPMDVRRALYRAEGIPQELEQKLEALIAADTETADPWFATVDAAARSAVPVASWRVGQRIGDYELVEELGRGGQGTVYLGRRIAEGLEGHVAIKLLRIDLATDAARQRFRQEQRILSGLEHPNIARFLGAGTTVEGTPYCVMEAVSGQPIDAYCQDRGLGLEARLDLFCRAADAVQAAHRQLIIHRDIKASNLLVTADGIPKLLDFGIAKLLDPGTTAAEVTQGPRHLTPEAASPEQIMGQRLTTATDIYSLGLLLFRLLTDHKPYDLSGVDFVEMQRIVCEVDLPLPSAISGNRRLRGDLDAIALQALHPSPEKRYPSVETMVEDIQRYRRQEPVHARAAGFSYRASKFLRRHSKPLLTAGLTLLLLMSVSLFFTLRLAAERDRAVAVEQLVLDLFETADPNHSLGEDLRVSTVIDQAALQLTALTDQPSVQSRLMTFLGSVYQTLGRHDQARELLEAGLGAHRDLGAPPRDVAEVLYRLGVLELEQGAFDAARAKLEGALALVEGLDEGDSLWLSANCRHRLAEVDYEQGAWEAALSGAEEALALRRRILGSEDPTVRQAIDLASNLDLLAGLQYQQRNHERAESLWREALDLLQGTVGQDHLALAGLWNNSAMNLRRLDRLDEAVEAMLEAQRIDRALLGDKSLRLGIRLLNLGNLYRRQGLYDQALESCGRALDMTLELRGEDHPNIPRIHACIDKAQRAKESSADTPSTP